MPYLKDIPNPSGGSVSSYVANTMKQLAPGTPVDRKADAVAQILNDKTLNPQERTIAIDNVNQTATATQIAAQGTAQAQD